MSILVRSRSSSSSSQPLDGPVRSHSDGIKRVRLLPFVEKMKNNFLEAIRQHGLDPALLPSLEPKAAECSLYLSVTAEETRGKRTTMEDAHFDCALREGHLIGLFDGHSEKGMLARQVARLFKEQFQASLDAQENGDIRQVFIDLIARAQNEVPVTHAGTTALVAYFHHATNQLYTATLGDSELKVYRKVDDVVHSIPVSVIRHWGIEKEEARFLSVVTDEGKKERWLKEKNPEQRRFPPEANAGLNVSRSIGEKSQLMFVNGKSAISRKPKVSMCQLLADDRVVLACDGLWHFVGADKRVTEQDFVEKVIKPHWNDPELSERIVTYALNTAMSTDNVTAMVATVRTEEPKPLAATPPIQYE